MRNLMLGLATSVVVAVAGAAAYVALVEDEVPMSPASVNVADADLGGPFTLTTHTGERVTEADLITGPTLIYFGYTFCPDVCPIDTQVMAETVDLLAEDGFDVTPVFVTVDPARDGPEELGYFVEALHPEMIGLTGSEAEIKQAADAYKVYYARVNVPGSAAEYLVNHTAFTYLMMPDGIAGLFRNGFTPKDIAGDVAQVLKRRGVSG